LSYRLNTAVDVMNNTLKGRLNPDWREALITVLSKYPEELAIKATEQATLTLEWIPRPGEIDSICKGLQPARQKTKKGEEPEEQSDIDFRRCLGYLRRQGIPPERAIVLANRALPMDDWTPRWAETNELVITSPETTPEEEEHLTQALTYVDAQREKQA
jgi:hypothetical protein